jgi:inner membrane protein
MTNATVLPRIQKNPAMEKLLFAGKIFFVGFLILVLFLPMGMIQSLITERNERHDSADWDVIKTWGGEQTLGGPVLTVPYRVTTQVDKKNFVTTTYYARFLPEDLKITGQIRPEVRYRGIFKIPLYRVDLQVQGRFTRPDFSGWRVLETDILWEDATLSVGIPDMRAIQEQVQLSWEGKNLQFGPGSGEKKVFDSGISVKVPGLKEGKNGQDFAFSFPLKLAGSRDLQFLPFGKETSVTLHSDWNNPSFVGAYLPAARQVDEKGFSAEWKVLHLGRNYPQQWLDDEIKPENFNDSAFGVSLLFPVDTYQKTTRCAKYAILFILLTFVTFFFFEILGKLRIHPIQYLLVGLALCLFYLLLLSLSEHLSFGLSYILATAGTVVMITSYSGKVLKNFSRASVMGAVIAGLYGYLYILLQLQDYALLLGSFGLFFILGLIMFITRKIDWYAVASVKGEACEA